MKVHLVAINSKYVHTNIAVRCISSYLKKRGQKCDISEYSTSEEDMRIASDIHSFNADIVAFSCYIWNIEKTLRVADIVKKANPKCMIILGGPEVSYNPDEIFGNYTFVDYIICGEGEEYLYKFVSGEHDIVGLAKRGEISTLACPIDLNEIPFIYSDEDLKEKERIFYYESARGCPYSCSFCLSASQCGVRYKDNDRVYNDIKKFVDSNVRIVKFIDRTFNANDKRACEILNFILELDGNTQFHFEIAGDRVSDEFIKIISLMPEGKIRLEIGIQSTNEDTLKEVNRACNIVKLKENVNRILKDTKAIIHLDLIAGLPYEDFDSFKKSFNEAFCLYAHELQLGFLKLLKGTPIFDKRKLYGYEYSASPPYEVVSNAKITFSELCSLKDIEAMVDYYYNSGSFKKTIKYLLEKEADPFNLFSEIAIFFKKRDLLRRPHHKNVLFDFLFEFALEKNYDSDDFKIEFIYDFLLACRGARLPDWLESKNDVFIKPYIQKILEDEKVLVNLHILSKVPLNSRHKHIKIQKIFNMIWFVSYIDQKIVDITYYF